ncbi:hypothetical protein H4R34_005074 [Dimargaris verticillata]|uniref:Uncharacterized protein n=1 Tax=Dimargaris verticillata TaxID=2761393 RepID=A0A9W8AYW8_9FUNG|nr:hypothetical protein H4R34_005074 [Dimargaris verticillata]
MLHADMSPDLVQFAQSLDAASTPHPSTTWDSFGRLVTAFYHQLSVTSTATSAAHAEALAIVTSKFPLETGQILSTECPRWPPVQRQRLLVDLRAILPPTVDAIVKAQPRSPTHAFDQASDSDASIATTKHCQLLFAWQALVNSTLEHPLTPDAPLCTLLCAQSNDYAPQTLASLVTAHCRLAHACLYTPTSAAESSDVKAWRTKTHRTALASFRTVHEFLAQSVKRHNLATTKDAPASSPAWLVEACAAACHEFYQCAQAYQQDFQLLGTLCKSVVGLCILCRGPTFAKHFDVLALARFFQQGCVSELDTLVRAVQSQSGSSKPPEKLIKRQLTVAKFFFTHFLNVLKPYLVQWLPNSGPTAQPSATTAILQCVLALYHSISPLHLRTQKVPEPYLHRVHEHLDSLMDSVLHALNGHAVWTTSPEWLRYLWDPCHNTLESLCPPNCKWLVSAFCIQLLALRQQPWPTDSTLLGPSNSLAKMPLLTQLLLRLDDQLACLLANARGQLVDDRLVPGSDATAAYQGLIAAFSTVLYTLSPAQFAQWERCLLQTLLLARDSVAALVLDVWAVMSVTLPSSTMRAQIQSAYHLCKVLAWPLAPQTGRLEQLISILLAQLPRPDREALGHTVCDPLLRSQLPTATPAQLLPAFLSAPPSWALFLCALPPGDHANVPSVTLALVDCLDKLVATSAAPSLLQHAEWFGVVRLLVGHVRAMLSQAVLDPTVRASLAQRCVQLAHGFFQALSTSSRMRQPLLTQTSVYPMLYSAIENVLLLVTDLQPVPFNGIVKVLEAVNQLYRVAGLTQDLPLIPVIHLAGTCACIPLNSDAEKSTLSKLLAPIFEWGSQASDWVPAQETLVQLVHFATCAVNVDVIEHLIPNGLQERLMEYVNQTVHAEDSSVAGLSNPSDKVTQLQLYSRWLAADLTQASTTTTVGQLNQQSIQYTNHLESLKSTLSPIQPETQSTLLATGDALSVATFGQWLKQSRFTESDHHANLEAFYGYLLRLQADPRSRFDSETRQKLAQLWKCIESLLNAN